MRKNVMLFPVFLIAVVALALGNAIHSITTSGEVTFMGFLDHRSKALAFDCVDPPSEI